MEYLLNAPLRVSDEDNISEFFEKCLWKEGWNLEHSIFLIRDKIQRIKVKNNNADLEYLKIQMEKQEETLTVTSDILRKIDNKVDAIIGFVRTDLKIYINKEKQVLKSIESSIGRENAVNSFIQDVCAHINNQIQELRDISVNLERVKLEQVFGKTWMELMPTSRISLISAGVLLKYCANINTSAFDFSGICICATAAFESELKRIFFDGFLKFMIDKWGDF